MEEDKQVGQPASNDKEEWDQELIDKSVAFINEKANETLYKGSLEIGRYILKYFFHNDIRLASSKNPKKPNSFKALCSHRDLAVPYSTLTVMVRVAAQEAFLESNHIDTDKLTYTHKANLIGLRNNEKKISLARRCIDEGLSTRRLMELVKLSRRKLLAQQKATQEETALKNILKIEQLMSRSEKSELITDINKIRSMHSKTREELGRKAKELLERMAQNTRDCKQLLKNIEKVKKERTSGPTIPTAAASDDAP